jgi:predicted metal-dependent enzyme (double-stranded beta helix superfamily)
MIFYGKLDSNNNFYNLKGNNFMSQIVRFREFVQSFSHLIRQSNSESSIVVDGKSLLAELIQHDDWLPDAFAQPHPKRYQQYLLFCDPLEHFSIVSFVWGPGQDTPIHDHTVWGMVGVMRGAEICQEYSYDDDQLIAGNQHRLEQGEIDLVSPEVGDIHTVSNAFQNRASISIHVYGANIGAVKRHVYSRETGQPKSFISGYSNTVIPNLWDRSMEMND